MTDKAPDEIRELARARSVAREAHDWAEADRLRAEIEAAGWKVVDQGTRFQLLPVAPADVVDGDRIRYGSSRSVPSRLEEAATCAATVVIAVADDAEALGRSIDGLRRSAPERTQIVVVADDPTDGVVHALEAADSAVVGVTAGERPLVVWTTRRLGPAGAANAGIRVALGEIVILLASGVESTGDIVTPLVAALDDPSVAVGGAWGRVSVDLRRWEDAPPGDVDVVDADLIAFRRTDYLARGPLDEGFRTAGPLATWWSLVLRDEGDTAPPRRAIRVPDVPVTRPEVRPDRTTGGGEGVRAVKRDFYRIIDRFGRRRDLLLTGRGA